MGKDLHKLCIRVPKVFDWVARQVDLPLISFDNEELDALFGFDDTTTPAETLADFLANFPGFTVQAVLQDQTVICQEIQQTNGRQEISVTLPDGDTVDLEKVKVLLKGLLVVNIFDANGNLLLTSDPIPFATAQTFFLCAPEGTDVFCHMTYFQADAEIILTDDFEQLDISIVLCLDVQMEALVKLEVEGAYCKPRPELPITDLVCPEDRFPPQCPEIFPGKHGKHCIPK
ncbi:hypothetical protein P4641_15290 [Halalkalibacterium halodurans]|uniref:hypothetical protein n=1 Tax=Halalkalibacterium halodurans TaxID=86665 RepID=UPI002E210F08|nr:hypothetical protein [Halalkalibacterium halodurans]